MTLLYISHLSQNIAAGMNWSVPASVKAQEQIDDVLWINTTNRLMPHWKEAKAYRNLRDLGEELSLACIPAPFNHPDLVVFEGLYFKEYLKFSKELRKDKIPYVIVPRGSMTHQALHNHAKWKKFFAHLLYFNSFIRHAWRIQYLTKQEAADSIQRFHTPYFIVPNGVSIPAVRKSIFSTGVKAVFIGRIDAYHKGLDMLLDAITQIAEELRKASFTLSIHGPKKYDHALIGAEIENRGLDDFVKLYGEVSGQGKEDALLQADLFIMTSRFEGHPMGLIEALSYGLPCLVTPGTNMADKIHEADAGWICKGDVEGIKQALLKALSEKDLFAKKSINAQLLSKEYDWNCLAKLFHEQISIL